MFCGLFWLALGVKVQAMVHDLNAKHLFNRCFYHLYTRVAKFQYFAGIRADYVVVLFVLVRFFELSEILPELMLAHKVTGQQ